MFPLTLKSRKQLEEHFAYPQEWHSFGPSVVVRWQKGRIGTSSSLGQLFNHGICWLDTELANTDKERSVVVVKGVLLLLFNFKSKLVQSKE
jgi:hypothetical protein